MEKEIEKWSLSYGSIYVTFLWCENDNIWPPLSPCGFEGKGHLPDWRLVFQTSVLISSFQLAGTIAVSLHTDPTVSDLDFKRHIEVRGIRDLSKWFHNAGPVKKMEWSCGRIEGKMMPPELRSPTPNPVGNSRPGSIALNYFYYSSVLYIYTMCFITSNYDPPTLPQLPSCLPPNLLCSSFLTHGVHWVTPVCGWESGLPAEHGPFVEATSPKKTDSSSPSSWQLSKS